MGTRLVTLVDSCTQVPVSGRPGQQAATIAASQRGRVSRRQLLTAGVTSSTIGRLVASGHLLVVHRGVYAVGHAAAIELGAETAALLAAGDGAVLSHWSAAILWGLVAGPGDRRVHITVPGRRGPTLSGVRVHRSRTLSARDVRRRAGLPVTSPARTLLDLAGLLPERGLELAFDRALVARIVRPSAVADVLEHAEGRGGRRRLRALVDRERGPALTRSEAEERFLALVRRAQPPEPMVNVRIHGYEVDFLWPGRLVVEIDDFRFHSTRSAFEHDRRKDATLQGAGLRVMRFGWDQIEREPYVVIARVAQGLAA